MIHIVLSIIIFKLLDKRTTNDERRNERRTKNRKRRNERTNAYLYQDINGQVYHSRSGWHRNMFRFEKHAWKGTRPASSS